MWIKSEDADEIVRFTGYVLNGVIHSHIDGRSILKIDFDNFAPEDIDIISASIENNMLHIVLETEEELLIPIRDD